MEHPPFTEQSHADTRALSFAYLRTKFNEQRFNLPPLDIATDWVAEYGSEGPPVTTFHDNIVPKNDTMQTTRSVRPGVDQRFIGCDVGETDIQMDSPVLKERPKTRLDGAVAAQVLCGDAVGKLQEKFPQGHAL